MRVCVCCTGRVCCASIAEVCVSLFKSKSFRMAEGLVVVQTFPPSSSLFFSSFTSFPLDLVACYYATPLPPFFFLNSYYYFLVRVPTGEFRDGVNERKGGERDVAFDSGQLVCKFPLNIRLAAHFADDTIRGSCVIRSSLSLQWAKQSLSGVGCFSQVWLSQRSDDWTSTCWPSCQQVSSLLLL